MKEDGALLLCDPLRNVFETETNCLGKVSHDFTL